MPDLYAVVLRKGLAEITVSWGAADGIDPVLDIFSEMYQAGFMGCCEYDIWLLKGTWPDVERDHVVISGDLKNIEKLGTP